MNKLLALTLAFATCAVGCASGVTFKVVDIDHNYQPIAGATIVRYPIPRRAGDPWSTTPAETKQTGADGVTSFSHDSGRWVITAPGKGAASFSSTFPPRTLEIGLGGVPANR